jgi:hypothetical protein
MNAVDGGATERRSGFFEEFDGSHDRDVVRFVEAEQPSSAGAVKKMSQLIRMVMHSLRNASVTHQGDRRERCIVKRRLQ